MENKICQFLLIRIFKMSKKTEKPAKSPEKDKKAGFPLCINNKQARMVCLSQSCEQYPFFCSNCQDSSCQIPHQHDDDRLNSVSYKEFTKRVLRERKPCDLLADAISSYRKVLQKLKDNVSQFIQRELQNIEDIEARAAEIEPEDEQLVQKLKNQRFKDLTGAMLDQLWTNSVEDPDKKKAEEQTAEFMNIKEEEVKGISEHFEHLNKLGIDNVPEEKEEKPQPEKNSKQPSNSPKPKKA